MKSLFKPEVLRAFVKGLIFLLIVKLLWFVVQIIWLTPVGTNQERNQDSRALYYRVKLTPNETPAPQKIVSAPKRRSGSIKDIILLAIYHASDISVITVEYKHKSKVLSTGDELNGYTLTGTGNNFAIFTKEAKKYKVMLDKKHHEATDNNSMENTEDYKKRANNKKSLGEVTNEGSVRIIDRSLLEHYAENMDDIYKNIGISEIKRGKNLEGFKIDFVRKDSPFSKMGIRRNDVIKSINGQEIKSYNEAFVVYKNIKNANELSLVVQRGKEEMELDYEIN